ncbi:MAG TPA: hypothetical protein ENK18_04985, partial [Deltaproteobacteria bacterium]|nr:hypothetical protein [Deltaproteobacteria bacterium]
MRTPTIWVVLGALGCSNDIQVAEKQNTAPAAAIQAPTSGSSYDTTEVIDFVGLVSDSNGLDDIVNVFWASSIDGELADIDSAEPDADGQTRLSILLSEGNHAITLTVTDSAGSIGEDSLNLSVGAAQQAPIVTIDEPINFQETYPGAEVDLIGVISDGQQSANTLVATWTVLANSTLDVVDSFVAPPTAAGTTQGTWIAGTQGNYKIQLSAGDDDGNLTTEEVFVVVVDPSFSDLDGDGYAPATGDCDDADADINPDADETCGDLTDHDCNNVI